MAETKEQFTASHRYARISARKARLVIDLIRGVPVEKALRKLQFCQRRAAPMIHKVVRSALANATQESGAEVEELVVWRAFVDEGPTLKRWRPRAMGRAYPRLGRTCHLSVVLKKAQGEQGEALARGPATSRAVKEEEAAN
jgi:large subunit ribosomal protein L22